MKFNFVSKLFCNISTYMLVFLLLINVNIAQADGFAKNKKHILTHSKIPIPDAVLFAKVILMPTGISSSNIMTESALINLGCTFETSDPLNIYSLIKILKGANIRVATHSSDLQEFEPREGIYLTLDNEKEVKLLFGMAFTNGNHVSGAVYYKPVGEKKFITGKQSLPMDLFDWAVDTGNQISKKNEAAQRECELFMKKEGFYSK